MFRTHSLFLKIPHSEERQERLAVCACGLDLMKMLLISRVG